LTVDWLPEEKLVDGFKRPPSKPMQSGMEPVPCSVWEHLHIQTLARLNAQMGQKVLAEGQLTLAGDFQGCCTQRAPPPQG
jgi:hypothetical protein